MTENDVVYYFTVCNNDFAMFAAVGGGAAGHCLKVVRVRTILLVFTHLKVLMRNVEIGCNLLTKKRGFNVDLT